MRASSAASGRPCASGSCGSSFCLLFVAQLSAMIIEPIVTLYISTLPSVSPENLASQAGLIFAVAGFTGLIAAPLWGRLGDRTGQLQGHRDGGPVGRSAVLLSTGSGG